MSLLLLAPDDNDRQGWLAALAGLGRPIQARSCDDGAVECIRSSSVAAAIVAPTPHDGSIFALVRKLRSEPRCARLPFLVLGEHPCRTPETDSVAMVEFLGARCPPELLQARVAALLDAHGRVTDPGLPQRELLEAILEHTSTGVVVCDVAGTIRVFNPAAERQHGATKAKVSAPDWAATFGLIAQSGEPLPLESTALYRAMKGEFVANARWFVKHPDGALRQLNGTAIPLHADDDPARAAGALLLTDDVTWEFETDHRLRRNDDRLRRVVEASGVGTWEADLLARDLQGDERLRSVLGLPPEGELDLHQVLATIHADDRASVSRDVQAALAGENSGRFAAEFRTSSPGGVAWVEARGQVYFDHQGTAVRFLGTGVDISERHAQQHALQASSRQLRGLVENLPDQAWTARADGHVDYFNRRWYEYTGADESNLGRDTQFKALHPDFQPLVIERWKHCLATGASFDMEFPVLGKDGVFRWFLTRVEPLLDDTGNVTRWFGTATNIDEQKKTQARLARHARQALLIGSVGASLTGGPDLRTALSGCVNGFVEHVQVASARIWELDPLGKTLVLAASAGMPLPGDAGLERFDVAGSIFESTLKRCEPSCTDHVPLPLTGGDANWAHAHRVLGFAAYPLFLGERAVGVLALLSHERLAEDLLFTLDSIADSIALGIERYRSEEARHDSEIRYRLATHATRDAIWDWTLSDNSVVWTKQVFDLFGFRREDIEPTMDWWRSRLHPDDRDRLVADMFAALARPDEERWESEHRFQRHNGTFALVANRCAISRDSQGRAVRVVGALKDITVRRQAELQRERLIKSLENTNRELDQFAYVASHDLKAPLRGIANLSQWIEEDLGTALVGDARKHMDLLRGRVQRLEGIINGLLGYSRAGRGQNATKLENVDVAALLAETVELLAPPSDARIDIHGPMPVLHTARMPLQQVFMNLISNALTHGRSADGTTHVTVTAARQGDTWQFSVADRGAGIAPEFHKRVWEIFQTLEARDKVESTGIGLAVVRKVVEYRGGRAWIEPTSGPGSTFTFTWPLSAAETD